MPETYDLILKGGAVATPSGIAAADVAVREALFTAITPAAVEDDRAAIA